MHTNHRRKPERQRGPGYRHGSWKSYQRIFWREWRARQRRLMFIEEYDHLPMAHRRSVQWDYW